MSAGNLLAPHHPPTLLTTLIPPEVSQRLNKRGDMSG
eukprot:COSAG01_NODE_50311_length_364_cov_0.909434_1_plen_36_part_10